VASVYNTRSLFPYISLQFLPGVTDPGPGIVASVRNNGVLARRVLDIMPASFFSIIEGQMK